MQLGFQRLGARSCFRFGDGGLRSEGLRAQGLRPELRAMLTHWLPSPPKLSVSSFGTSVKKGDIPNKTTSPEASLNVDRV